MKTNYLILSVSLALLSTSCKKDEDSKMMKQTYATENTVTENNGKTDSAATTSTETEVDGKKVSTVSYPYKAEDGTRAKATFINDGKSKTITIEANNVKYVLDFKRAIPTGEIYERNSISAEVSEDSLLISQGNNVIHLGKIK